MKKFFLIFFFQITSLFGREITIEQLTLLDICKMQKTSNQRAECYYEGLDSLKSFDRPEGTLLSICNKIGSFFYDDRDDEAASRVEYLCIRHQIALLPYSDNHSKTMWTCEKVLANTESHFSAVQCISERLRNH